MLYRVTAVLPGRTIAEDVEAVSEFHARMKFRLINPDARGVHASPHSPLPLAKLGQGEYEREIHE